LPTDASWSYNVQRSMEPRSKDLAACEPTEHDVRTRTEPRVSEDAYERAARFFRAAGDIARLKLLTRLADGEWCVTELAQAAGVALPTVSQQLRLLRTEGLVKRRRVAKHVYTHWPTRSSATSCEPRWTTRPKDYRRPTTTIIR
jgi:DNA-binding transcriptional ArsR family regulator